MAIINDNGGDIIYGYHFYGYYRYGYYNYCHYWWWCTAWRLRTCQVSEAYSVLMPGLRVSISIPQNGPILVLQSVVLDAFGVPPFLETSIYLYIYIDIYFYLFIFICGVWPSAGIILHMKWDAALDLRNDPARRAAYDAGKLGSDLAPKMQTLKTPHLGLTLVCFSWGFLISLPTLLNTWKLGRSKVTFKIIS